MQKINLFVASSVPVKTIIMPDSTGLQNFISFTSGEYRMFNAIGWRFIPGAQYRVFVIPQSTAEVTVSMSKSSSVLTWVTMGNSEITEKNMLMGGLTDQYGIAFKSSGTYRITVSTVSKLTAVFSDAITPSQSKVVQLSNNSYVFDNLKINATGEVQNNYGIILTGNDPVNGGAYTVKIERLY